jgi:hypothetical protein
MHKPVVVQPAKPRPKPPPPRPPRPPSTATRANERVANELIGQGPRKLATRPRSEIISPWW